MHRLDIGNCLIIFIVCKVFPVEFLIIKNLVELNELIILEIPGYIIYIVYIICPTGGWNFVSEARWHVRN